MFFFIILFDAFIHGHLWLPPSIPSIPLSTPSCSCTLGGQTKNQTKRLRDLAGRRLPTTILLRGILIAGHRSATRNSFIFVGKNANPVAAERNHKLPRLGASQFRYSANEVAPKRVQMESLPRGSERSCYIEKANEIASESMRTKSLL